MRILGLAAFAAAFALAGPAMAAALPFNPEDATRAWLDTMGAEATARSNSYFEGGYLLDYAGTALSIIVAGLMLVLGLGRGVRSWLEKTVKWFPLVIFGSAFFYILVSTILTFPFSYYMGFVRQHEYNLSTQTFAEWFNEQLIGLGLALVIGSLFITVLYLIIRAARKTWWVWGSVVTIAFAAVMSMLFPGLHRAALQRLSTPMPHKALCATAYPRKSRRRTACLTDDVLCLRSVPPNQQRQRQRFRIW
jgi:STE24 endopeptidase